MFVKIQAAAPVFVSCSRSKSGSVHILVILFGEDFVLLPCI